MKDSSLGIPIIRDTYFGYGDHQPSTVEITKPHPLNNSNGAGYNPTKSNYVTVLGYNSEGGRVGYHHVIQLPTKLGNTATQLMASAWAARFALKI